MVKTETVCQDGATLGPFDIQGVETTLTVPAGAFAQCVTITITSGRLSQLALAAFPGFSVLASAGVQVDLNGAPYPGVFLMPLTLTWRSSAVTAATAVSAWNGASPTMEQAGRSAAGVATVTFDSDPDFVLQNPVSAPVTRIAGATVPVTGKPLLGEGILAGSLLAAGLGGFGLSRRRRARG